MTRFITINDATSGHADGTCLRGHIMCNYEDIVECFGEPEDLKGTLGDGKVDVQWTILFGDGTVATIYNWKNGPMYCGIDGDPPEHIKRWNVGGKSYRALEHVASSIEGSSISD